jgi:DNA topoisomerase-1
MPQAIPLDRPEGEESAERAGLRYTTDADPGIRRERVGDDFVYFGPNGQRITNEQRLRRIASLAVPPAWTDVWICAHANGHLQVTARDAKGRKQYRYHARFRAIRDETKFDRMIEFSRVLPAARRRVEAHLRLRGLPREKILASVVWLLERTLIRVGNTEYARDNETYGLTTLQDRHADVKGSTIQFSFVGKSGREHTVSISDRRLARIVQRCQTLPGEELFKYVDEEGEQRAVGSGDINEYLREVTGASVTAKDFRTWAGTMLAARALRALGPVRLVKEKRANIARAVDQVAERLGNTRAVCLKYYIHPLVIEAYRRGQLIPEAVQGRGKGSEDDRRAESDGRLRKDERAVLKLIEANRR